MDIISGGSFCISAHILRKYDIRTGAMPFDWLFCSVRNLIHILDDDFDTFLQRSNYRSITSKVGRPSCLHGIYDGGNVERPLFRHKDPSGDRDYLYYRRSVERFRQAASRGATMLVIEEFGEIEQLFPKLLETIARRYPKIRLRAVRHRLSEDGISLNMVEKADAHELWQFAGSAVVNGLSLARTEEEALIVGAILRPGEPAPTADPAMRAERSGRTRTILGQFSRRLPRSS